MRRICICHVVSGDLWAGAEVMVGHLLSGLRTRPNIDVFAIVLNDGLLARKLNESGIECLVLDERKLNFLQIAWLAAKAVRARRPKIIHSHRYKENLLACIISIAAGRRTSLVTTQHGMPEFYAGHRNLWQRLVVYLNQQILAKWFDKTVAVSRDIRLALAKLPGMQDDRVVTIHNGISFRANRMPRKRRGTILIGSAGRFFPVKDYPFMVQIASEVRKLDPSITFQVAGDGPQQEVIQAAIERCCLSTEFKLVGFVGHIEDFLDKIDIYLNTSIHEGIPMSVLEAMEQGLPIVAPTVGGFQEIITDGVEGFLVPVRDPVAFAARCIALCRDHLLREAMGRAARMRIKDHFSVEKMVDAYSDLYLRLPG